MSTPAPSRRILAPAGVVPSITVSIPTPIRRYCDGKAELPLQAATVAEVLEILARQYPDLHGCVCDETGAVRRHINLFVNHDHMRERNGLGSTLEAGDVVTIMTAVSGG